MLHVLAQTGTLPMPDVEWSLIWPLTILAIGSVLLVTITSLVPTLRTNGFPALFFHHGRVAAAALLPYTASASAMPPARSGCHRSAMVVDHFTVFVTGVICLSVLLVSLILDDYLRREGFDGPEWYVLMLLSASGGVILAAANDLIVTFLGLEILSIAVYVLAALQLRRTQSQEAGFKYFVLGALSSAIFLYGIALTYGAIGSTNFDAVASVLGSFFGAPNAAGLTPVTDSSMLLVGMAMILIGFAFKVSAVPFHFWTPDVYQGAPTPVVAFMASSVKVAGFAALLRVFVVAFNDRGGDWRPLIGALALFSILLGSVMAIVQTDVKRMLAYSSISHAGFMLIGVHAAGSATSDVAQSGARAVLFYMLSYTAVVAGTFAVVTAVSGFGDGNTSLDDFTGMARRHPVLASMLVVLLFSQAGIPFTSGFFAKFRVIVAAADGGAYVMAGIAMLGSVIGAFLYLRIVIAMFTNAGGDDHGDDHSDEVVEGDALALPGVGSLTVPTTVLLAVGLAVFATLLLGIWPAVVDTPLTDGARSLLGLAG
ncbi:MAG: NADH-quinone oxidoreductase subunit N [Acidimicrobiales bacterium]